MLSVVLTVLLAGILLSWLRHAAALWDINRLPNLARETEAPPAEGWPRLSVVVACRNEEGAIRQALSSVLAQDYPGLEVVAVDDRSEDRTGAILDELAAANDKLRVLHIETLPAGWLGKTHALHRGAATATGELLLFTDADVVFAPGALRRAVTWTVRHGLDHAVALPHFVAHDLVERAFVSLFALLLLLRLGASAINRGGEGYVGIGAFNLVRAGAYRAIDGHSRLRLEVLDDVKLGLLMRWLGARRGCADSGGMVSVRWQHGLVASMRGLIKNFFAGCEYRWRNVLRDALLVTMGTVVPTLCLALAPGSTVRWLAAAALAVAVALQGAAARRMAGGRGYEGLLLPIAGLCVAGVAVASAAVATARGAIVWRGTRYDLRELEAHCVREADWPPGGGR